MAILQNVTVQQRLDEVAPRIRKRQETLKKVAPTQEQPTNGPGEWTRARYSAMFLQYKEVTKDLVDLLDICETILAHNALLANEISELKFQLKSQNAEPEVYEGDIPPEYDVIHEDLKALAPESEVLNQDAPAPDAIEIPVQEIDLLA